MSRLPEPATPRRSRWRRTRAALLTATAAALTAQLLPAVHTMLSVLVAASWTLIGLLVARALAHRHGLRLPAWVSVPVATRAVTRLAGRLAGRLRASRHPAPVSPPLTAGQDYYELAGGPVMSPAGER